MASSVIHSIAYDSDHSRLTVVFVSGRVYDYYLVPPSVAASLQQAPSKGAFFNKFVRDRYICREVMAA